MDGLGGAGGTDEVGVLMGEVAGGRTDDMRGRGRTGNGNGKLLPVATSVGMAGDEAGPCDVDGGLATAVVKVDAIGRAEGGTLVSATCFGPAISDMELL